MVYDELDHILHRQEINRINERHYIHMHESHIELQIQLTIPDINRPFLKCNNHHILYTNNYRQKYLSVTVTMQYAS